MPARYTALPNPRAAPDAEREMADAFDLDDENDDHSDNETTPLTVQTSPSPAESSSHGAPLSSLPSASVIMPGTYDFERDYDIPPPGSPPRPTDRALPNDYGNSNGFVPTSPIERPAPRQPSFFHRMLGPLLPTRYSRLPTGDHRSVGGGVENDGVFANVVAKPQRAQVVHTEEDGSVYVMPEETQKDVPPSYIEAQADAVPPYWETTVHAPAGFEPGGSGEVIVDDLPTGSLAIFCINVFISFFFQFVGFLLTYLLHTSHAAKYGSRAGLGLTLIQFGFVSRSTGAEEQQPVVEVTDGDSNWFGQVGTPTPDASGAVPTNIAPVPNDTIPSSSRDWLSFLFMTLGWFLLLSSVIGYWRVKRWEQSIRNPPAPITPEQIERDRRVRQTLEDVFGVPFTADDTPEAAQRRAAYAPPPGAPPAIPSRDVLEEARLTRDLHAAGLI